MSLEKITRAAGTVTISGTMITLRQLSLLDFGHFMAWMRQKTEPPFAKAVRKIQALAKLKEIDPELFAKKEEQYLLEAEAADKDDNFTPSQMLVQESVMSPEGMSYFIWLAAKSDQPTLTQGDIQTLIAKQEKEDPSKIQDIFLKVMEVMQAFVDADASDPTKAAVTKATLPLPMGAWTGASSLENPSPNLPGPSETLSIVRPAS